MASTPTSTFVLDLHVVPGVGVSPSPSSLLWNTRQVSAPEVPLVIDEKFFQIDDFNKYKEIVNKYSYLLQKENAFDTFILNKYIHRRCSCCTKYTCGVCLTIVFHNRDDFLLPYCYNCESFLEMISN